jgi:uncharacterized membrane protein/nitrite reductase/ring-hydroxylating ferredoxin subunit
MRSKMHIKGHPVHPILVAFPIAFFTGALMSDIIWAATGRYFFAQCSIYLGAGGILFGILAAIPGIMDFFMTVPPDSSGKKRGAKHGILNALILLLFAIIVQMRRNGDLTMTPIISLETVGVIMLSISGWLGGTLVNRNQIGVDHRYARAGKWNEVFIQSKEKKVELCGIDKLEKDQMMLFHINGKRIAVGKGEKGHYAFDDRCTHRGGSLADGVMICDTVQCPWHGSQFSVKDGKIQAGPAKKEIKAFSITREGSKYYLTI